MVRGNLLTSVYTSLTFRTYICGSFHQIIFKHGNFTFKGTRFSRVDGFCVNCSGQKLNKSKKERTKETWHGLWIAPPKSNTFKLLIINKPFREQMFYSRGPKVASVSFHW